MRVILGLVLLSLTTNSIAVLRNEYKLPPTIYPYSYQLKLRPDFYNKEPSQFMLYGNVSIYAKVRAPTNEIKLHSLGIKFNNVKVIHNGKDIFSEKKYEAKFQWNVLTLKRRVEAKDTIIIEIKNFERSIDHSKTGLYYYARIKPDGGKSYGVTTQMEATHARQAFPCFDEPVYKATFDVWIFRKAPFYSISNGKRRYSTPSADGWTRDIFHRSPRMSTYLVAIVVTDYKALSEKYRNVNFTIYYPEGMESKVQIAMKLSKMIMEKLQEYFGEKYPIPKLDQIGFRTMDYKYGGMENWGMITYGYPYLYANKFTSSRGQTWVAAVVLHEIVHQWFGNLVTMPWWDDLWLNEGMTQFFSFLKGKWIEEFHPLREGIAGLLNAMDIDAFRISYPVYVPWAHSPQQILSVVNPITYNKGGIVVKMAELILGEDNFKFAMQRYMKKYKYRSVTHEDLWKMLSSVSSERRQNYNFSQILNPWIKQAGFPVVTIALSKDRKSFTYSQKLFRHKPQELDSKRPSPSVHGYKWTIPIQWITGNNPDPQMKLGDKTEGVISLKETLEAGDWFIVNPESNFFYVVNYEASYWKEIAQHLKSDYLNFSEFTRTKILFDMLMLYKATTDGKGNFVSVDIVNEVFSYIPNESSKMVVTTCLNFVFKHKMRQDRNIRPSLVKLIEAVKSLKVKKI